MRLTLPILSILALVAASVGAHGAEVSPTSPEHRVAQQVSVPGGTLAFDDTGGAGPLIVCVPGMGDVRQQYRFLTPLLVRAGFRVVTMDLRGMGDSSVGWPDYSPAAVGGDIVAMVRHLGAQHVFIAGNSFAGGSAVWAATEIPDQVAGIILIDSFVRDHQISIFTRLELDFALHRPWGPGIWASYYRSLYKEDPPADLDAYIAVLEANLKQQGRFEALTAMAWAPQTTCEARIPALKTRVLVIMGSADPDFDAPAAEADWIGTHLHAQVLMVPNVGHYPHVEKPQVVAQAITAFVNEQPNAH
ncbi:MAG: alpha/beta fold hydrolase [Candidatus Binataceae bacterium]